MYQSLMDMERKLDWTMTRKKVEVQDALSRVPNVRFYLHSLLKRNHPSWPRETDNPYTANLPQSYSIWPSMADRYRATSNQL